MNEHGGFGDVAIPSASAAPTDWAPWHCEATLRKYTQHQYDNGLLPYQTVQNLSNVPTIGGISLLLERGITLAPSTSATGAALQALSSGNASIGVSTSTAAASKSSTALAGSPVWSSHTSGDPHTDSIASTAAQTMTFKGSWGTTQANFAWRSWAVANSTVSGYRMVNHALQNLGTKTTGTWTLTVKLSITTG